MIPHPYFTLCVWDTVNVCWYDQFGSYSRREVAEEKTLYLQDGYSPRHVVIIKTDETAEAMMKARDALPHPDRVSDKG